jgi:hypothetical protein
MRTHIVLPALCLALIAWDDSSFAQTAPQAGQWELTTDMQGMPFGGGAKTSKACIKAEQMTAGPEQAIVEAGMASTQSSNSSGNAPPKCSLPNLSARAMRPVGKPIARGHEGLCKALAMEPWLQTLRSCIKVLRSIRPWASVPSSKPLLPNA